MGVASGKAVVGRSKEAQCAGGFVGPAVSCHVGFNKRIWIFRRDA